MIRLDDAILKVKGLMAAFPVTKGGLLNVVDDVSFEIERGRVFGIVGESGSGKTMLALSIVRLLPWPGNITSGSILFSGIDLTGLQNDALRAIRGAKIAFVFQEPAMSFNPVFTIGGQIHEAVMAHNPSLCRTEATDLVLKYLEKVRLPGPDRIYSAYPHELSGGMKQRAMIAMALVNSPDLVILDEPTTALDVTIQAQILTLLEELIKKENLSILFISHDFGVIARMCDRVAVMKSGRIVETGKVEDVFKSPVDPYTISLINSVKALV